MKFFFPFYFLNKIQSRFTKFVFVTKSYVKLQIYNNPSFYSFPSSSSFSYSIGIKIVLFYVVLLLVHSYFIFIISNVMSQKYNLHIRKIFSFLSLLFSVVFHSDILIFDLRNLGIDHNGYSIL